MGLEGLLFLCPIFRSVYSHTHTPLPSVVTRSLAGYENCTTGGSALAWPPRDLSAVTLRDTQPQPSGLPQNAKILTHSRVFTWSSCTKITGFCSFFCLFTEFGGVQASRSRHGRFSLWGHPEMGRLPSVRVPSRSCLDPSHGTKIVIS